MTHIKKFVLVLTTVIFAISVFIPVSGFAIPTVSNPEIVAEAKAIAFNQGYGDAVPVTVNSVAYECTDSAGIISVIKQLAAETEDEEVVRGANSILDGCLFLMNGCWFTNIDAEAYMSFYTALPGHSMVDYNNALNATEVKINEIFNQICVERGLDEYGYPAPAPPPLPESVPESEPVVSMLPASLPSVPEEPPVITVPSVSAAASSYNKVKVSWTQVEGVKGYQVYRATSEYGTYKKVRTTRGLCYTNSKLKTGTTYYYKVRAYTKVGKTTVYNEFSAPVAVTPVLSDVPSIKASAYSPTAVKISWGKVSGRSRYEVWRSTLPDSGYVLVKSTRSACYKDTKLTPSVTGNPVTYYYMVRAYRKVSGQRIYSAYTAVASATPSFSDVSSVSVSRISASKIKVSWSKVPGAKGYEVWRSNTPDGGFKLIKSTSSRSFTNTRLVVGATYYYKVRAYVKAGRVKVYSAESGVASVPTDWIQLVSGNFRDNYPCALKFFGQTERFLFKYKWSSGRMIVIDPDWVNKYITSIPGLSGEAWTVHVDAVPYFNNAISYLGSTYIRVSGHGYDSGIIKLESLVKTYYGAYYPRYVTGNEFISHHAFGTAIDLNAEMSTNKNSISNRNVIYDEVVNHLTYNGIKESGGVKYFDFSYNGTWTDYYQGVPTSVENYLLYELAFFRAGFGWGYYYSHTCDAMHYTLTERDIAEHSGGTGLRKVYVYE